MTLHRSPTASILLAETPRLATWDAKDHPSQRLMAVYLAGVSEVLDRHVAADVGEPLSLRLDVGLQDGVALTGAGGDLDNYLYPIVARFGADRFVSAWATKRHGPSAIHDRGRRG